VMADMDRRRAVAEAKASRLRDSVALVRHQVEALRAVLPRKSTTARAPGGAVVFAFDDLEADRAGRQPKRKAANTARDAWLHSSAEERAHLNSLKQWVRGEWTRRSSMRQSTRAAQRAAAVLPSTQAAFLRDTVWSAPYSDDILHVFKRHAADLAAHRRLVLPLPHEQYSRQGGAGSSGRSGGAFFSPVRSGAFTALRTHGAAAVASRIDEDELQLASEQREVQATDLHRQIQAEVGRDVAAESAYYQRQQAQQAESMTGASQRALPSTGSTGSAAAVDDREERASVQTSGGGAPSSAVALQLARMQAQLADLQGKHEALQHESSNLHRGPNEGGWATSAPSTPGKPTDGGGDESQFERFERFPKKDHTYTPPSNSFGGASLRDTHRSDVSGTSSALVLGAQRGSPESNNSSPAGAYVVQVPAYRGSSARGFEWGRGTHTGAALHAGSRPATEAPQYDAAHPRSMKHMLLPFSGHFSHEAPMPVHAEMPPLRSAPASKGGSPEEYAPLRRRASAVKGRGSEGKQGEVSGPSSSIISTAVWMGMTGARRASILDGQGGVAVLRTGAAAAALGRMP
jgi:hypothetical protein